MIGRNQGCSQHLANVIVDRVNRDCGSKRKPLRLFP